MDTAPTATPTSPHSPLHALRILVIEDDSATAEALRALLAGWGHEVLVAPGGLAGAMIARRVRPDVILCELAMAGMDGYTTASLLGEYPALAGIRLIALAPSDTDAVRRRSRQAGFERFVVRPVNPEELRRVLGLPARR